MEDLKTYTIEDGETLRMLLSFSFELDLSHPSVQSLRVFQKNDLDYILNEFLKKKTNASVLYYNVVHNEESKDFIYIIATATGIP